LTESGRTIPTIATIATMARTPRRVQLTDEPGLEAEGLGGGVFAEAILLPFLVGDARVELD